MTIQVTPLKQYLENIQVLAPDKTEKQVQELFKTIILENVDFNGNEEMLTYLSDKAPNFEKDRKSTRLNSSHLARSRMPSSA